jgi:helicase required for RNAi-mediated heterochromatin assembly 1
MALMPAPIDDLKHIVDRPLQDKEAYLETQYRLLRFEGVELLRRSIQEFRMEPMMGETEDTAIYTKARTTLPPLAHGPLGVPVYLDRINTRKQVFVHGYTPTKIGTACRVGFSTDRAAKRIRWTHTDRLKCGNIVALSPETDNFRNICMVATIAARRVKGGLMPDEDEHEHTPPRIDIFWANPKDAIIDPFVNMVMIESKSGYFEGVRHTLRGLQLQSGNR